ncbi:MAG TPA: Rrf2 family transcriptional regulator [Spirochaetota bacterium]|nr:Rrf2 family transcriptional regulator [Spirochaetota bacterium]
MKSLLSLSEGASLALHGLVLVAKRHPERVSARELALALDASEAHLAKVFQKLHRAGIVDSLRGPAGGFSLARPAGGVSLIEIYQIIDGTVHPGACPLGKTKCLFRECIFTGGINGILAELHDKLASITLADVIGHDGPEAVQQKTRKAVRS